MDVNESNLYLAKRPIKILGAIINFHHKRPHSRWCSLLVFPPVLRYDSISQYFLAKITKKKKDTNSRKSKKSISLLKCWILNANWISLELYTVISTSLKNLLELFPICYFTQFNLSIYFSFGEWEISWKWLRFFYGRVCFFRLRNWFGRYQWVIKGCEGVVMNFKWENVFEKVFKNFLNYLEIMGIL